jgi:pimeloyl-ACP methyl ester carboxylesterase
MVGRIAPAFGLLTGAAALAAGGVAAGLELERRIVTKRILRQVDEEPEDLFGLRSAGPKIITPDGVTLHTEVDEVAENGASDLTLVFVHGFALSMDCWHFQRKHFRGRMRQVFYDLRSHGRSTRSQRQLCRIPQLADDLAQILDEVVGNRPVILVGHSMGGMTIMRLVQTQPDRFGSQIRGVALFSTSAGEMAEHSPIRGLPGRTFARVAEPMLAALNRIPELIEHGRRAGSDLGYVATRRFAFASDVPPGYVEFVSEMLAETPLEVIADFYPAFAELDEYRAFEVLGRIPTAVIGGEDDLFTPVTHTDRILELLPDTDAQRLPKCGHLPMIEHSTICNEILDRLVQRTGHYD